MVKKIVALFVLLAMPSLAFGKDDWHMQMHKWIVANQANPKCKVRYVTGIYRADVGSQPAWGMMTEEMFDWFSEKGSKIAPSVCPASRATLAKAEYRILFAQTPMRTQTETVHGVETQTQTQPTQTAVNVRTSYQDGSSTNTTGTISGSETTTVVVPTETTYTQSSSTLYMYTYRLDPTGWHLVAEDSVNYNRSGVIGSGNNYAAIYGGVGNMIRASRDKHRPDKLYKTAMESIVADQ